MPRTKQTAGKPEMDELSLMEMQIQELLRRQAELSEMSESSSAGKGKGKGVSISSDDIGMLAESKSLYQKRNKDGKYQWVTEYPDDLITAAENSETAKYAFLVRHNISYDSRKTLEIDSLVIQSPLLKKALGVVLKDYPGVTTNLQRLEFRKPFQPFVHRWNRLIEVLEATEDEKARSHLQLFYDVMHEELKEAIAAKIDLVKNGVMTFKYLWTIYEPGTLVYGADEGQERVYCCTGTSYGVDQRSGREMLHMSTWGVDWDGDKFGTLTESLSNYDFDGTKLITKLAYFPLEFHPHQLEVMDRLIARGKLFEKYAGYHFMAYKGVCLAYGRCGLIKQSIDSRIVIDCKSHNRMLPNRAINVGHLTRTATSILGGPEDNDVQEYDTEDEGADSYDEEDSTEYISTPGDTDEYGSSPKHRALTNRELLLSVPYVRGYALKNKNWLIFFVDQILPIKFSETAFASLVLPNEQKELIRAFVECQVKHKSTFDDVIEGKGRGMIMLLSGPPGVGKTLTAESVAENMRVPLYMMSAGDLGLDPSGIEESLNTIMEMVASWNAVLLLDEADVFLEARSTSDLERNKLVSIFLRVLEYYEGTLFLTTNRIKHIDDAFHSRIHISMQYPSLTATSRKHIWKTFLGRHAGLRDGQLDALSQVELNGRQIKNVLKTAGMLARRGDGDGKVDMTHIETILAIERGKVFKD